MPEPKQYGRIWPQDWLVNSTLGYSHTVQARGAAHPKILSLPLGVKGEVALFAAMRKAMSVKKTKLLLINNSGWRHRQGINEMVGAKFGIAANAYAVGRERTPKVDICGIVFHHFHCDLRLLPNPFARFHQLLCGPALPPSSVCDSHLLPLTLNDSY